MDWAIRYGKKLLLKEGLGIIFIGACALAKMAPIFDDGYYKADALLYMIIAGLAYHLWRYWD